METSERIGWILLGCVIGFVLGYVVRALKDIEEKVHHVEEVVNEDHQFLHKDEEGLARHPVIFNVVLFGLICLTVWAAISTGRVNTELKQTQGDLKKALTCLEYYNTRQGLALGGRDQANKDATQSEIDLWTKYGRLFELAKSDPSKIPVLQEQLNKAVLDHRSKLIDVNQKRSANPYAAPNILQDCKEKHD